MPQPRIFVSHSHHDTAWCASLVAALPDLGLPAAEGTGPTPSPSPF